MAAIEVITGADPASLAPFDAVIDVRSPAEFAEDHAPGAISLPVLDDEERARVGTIYVQQSRFLARRIGAALIARNVARHLETALADKDGSFRPLVYCWRGGQRSSAMAHILSEVGWRTAVLAGGYKTYRRHVQTRLYDERPPLKLVLLEGRTGSGKTDVLNRLPARGVQAIDLEGLAAHRGSLLGALVGVAQPSQKMFESQLLATLDALDPARPIVVEAESSKVGERMVPPSLWSAMSVAPRITLSAPLEARARYLAAGYADVVAERAVFEDALNRLPTFPGRKRIDAWLALADVGALDQLAGELMELHYDPAYERSQRKDPHPRIGEVALAGLGPDELDRAACEVAAIVNGLG